MDDSYVKDLEKFFERMLNPLKDNPFTMVIRLISKCKVLPFDGNKDLVVVLSKSFNDASIAINKHGIKSGRPNEVGNKIEPFVKTALNQNKIAAIIPEGRSAGDPDLMFEFNKENYYLECKSFSSKTEDSSQRTFYFSPSKTFKVKKDACHLMVSYRVYTKNKKFFVDKWSLYSLETLKVDLKHEFNQSNKKMYDTEGGLKLIASKTLNN
ncbi:MAG: hypothetical protein UT15_C0012G0009 [Berkelbacteria bacterium GW2011_GWA1_39_10]|uniref:Uncharacterized protein n=1 Tax=Berkelbacteria bacterium GW2011_GWA1_39_10 TaxID=1618332 RepID=A0A0G0LEY8_9BACT|nr:MAG: hypothetical protein UT15_C0012G0009 [Berkelbacteria bacterium GW2011_GWA1_39_10]